MFFIIIKFSKFLMILFHEPIWNFFTFNVRINLIIIFSNIIRIIIIFSIIDIINWCLIIYTFIIMRNKSRWTIFNTIIIIKKFINFWTISFNTSICFCIYFISFLFPIRRTINNWATFFFYLFIKFCCILFVNAKNHILNSSMENINNAF